MECRLFQRKDTSNPSIKSHRSTIAPEAGLQSVSDHGKSLESDREFGLPLLFRGEGADLAIEGGEPSEVVAHIAEEERRI